MRAKTKSTILVLFSLLILGLVACGTDSGASVSQIDETGSDVQSVAIADDDHDDGDTHEVAITDEHDDGDTHDIAITDEHDDGDGHQDVALDTHEDEEAESHAHAQMDGMVDPNAPVMNVFASEFGYETDTTEVAAGMPFSININNAGVLEHDITFVGLEDEFGLHVQPGETDIATFSIDEAGEYVYYCTIPGHREAGMTGTLMVEAAHVAADDEANHGDDHDVLEIEDTADHDEAAAGA